MEFWSPPIFDSELHLFFLASSFSLRTRLTHPRENNTDVSAVQFNSVVQACPTICDPMACSMPGIPVHCQLPEFTQTHVHWVGIYVPETPFRSMADVLILKELELRQAIFFSLFRTPSLCCRIAWCRGRKHILVSQVLRYSKGLLRWHNGKASTCQCRRPKRRVHADVKIRWKLQTQELSGGPEILQTGLESRGQADHCPEEVVALSRFPVNCIGKTLLCISVCECAQSLRDVWLFVTPQTVACQAPLSMGFPRQEYGSGLPSRGSSQPRDCTYVSCVSCIGRWILYHCATWETLYYTSVLVTPDMCYFPPHQAILQHKLCPKQRGGGRKCLMPFHFHTD